jgi:S1-C subfamily serine protease
MSDKRTNGKEKTASFGGYSTRYEYEQREEKKFSFKKTMKFLAFLLLFALSVVGVISLIRGEVFPQKETDGENAGSIKVPTQQELSEKEKTVGEMLVHLEESLLTLEIEEADGTLRYGTGFLVSSEGHGVISSSLLGETSPKNITAYTGGGVVSTVTFLGTEESLGISLIRLESQYSYLPVTAENSSYVKRGERLFAVPSHKAKMFYGTVSDGTVASVGPPVRIGEEGYQMNVNMIYLNMTPNESMYGAAVVDSTGAVVGFLTKAVAPPYGSLSSVVPINMVYTVVNDILSQS